MEYTILAWKSLGQLPVEGCWEWKLISKWA